MGCYFAISIRLAAHFMRSNERKKGFARHAHNAKQRGQTKRHSVEFYSLLQDKE